MPLRSHYRLTADKREIKDFPKLPSATSFIRKTLYDILLGQNIEFFSNILICIVYKLNIISGGGFK